MKKEFAIFNLLVSTKFFQKGIFLEPQGLSLYQYSDLVIVFKPIIWLHALSTHFYPEGLCPSTVINSSWRNEMEECPMVGLCDSDICAPPHTVGPWGRVMAHLVMNCWMQSKLPWGLSLPTLDR